MSEKKSFMHIAALGNARKQYSDFIEMKVRNAIDSVLAEGMTPSFYNIAIRAQVARSTLYRKSDLRELVEAARSAVQDAQLADSAILKKLQRENRELQEKVRRLEMKLNCLRLSASKRNPLSAYVEYAIINVAKVA